MSFHHLILLRLSFLLRTGYLICYFVRDNEDMPLWRGGFLFCFLSVLAGKPGYLSLDMSAIWVFYITSHYILCNSQTLKNLIPEEPANVSLPSTDRC